MLAIQSGPNHHKHVAVVIRGWVDRNELDGPCRSRGVHCHWMVGLAADSIGCGGVGGGHGPVTANPPPPPTIQWQC